MDDRASDDVRTAARAFACLLAGFLLLSGTLIAVHGFTGMHDAGAAPLPAAAAETDSAAATVPPAESPTVTTTPTTEPGPLIIEVVMDEFSYRPRRVQVPVGIPVVLDVVNAGKVDHEVVIGDDHVQDEAEKAMAEAAHGSGGHGASHSHEADVPALYLGPGERGRIEWTFTETGTLLMGCHVPGHWAAGMKGFLDVEPA